jgi:hypothetical protein
MQVVFMKAITTELGTEVAVLRLKEHILVQGLIPVSPDGYQYQHILFSRQAVTALIPLLKKALKNNINP